MPSRTLLVRAANAASVVTDSNRGLASRLSPTNTASNSPEASAVSARVNSSATVVAPKTTPWLGSSSPSFMAVAVILLPVA